MLHSVFFALMVGSPTHPPLRTQVLYPPTHHTGQCPAPTHPPPSGSRNATCLCSTVQTARPHLSCKHCLLEAGVRMLEKLKLIRATITELHRLQLRAIGKMAKAEDKPRVWATVADF